jgi:hypothetical protein
MRTFLLLLSLFIAAGAAARDLAQSDKGGTVNFPLYPSSDAEQKKYPRDTAHLRECVWAHWIQSSRVRDSQLRTANKLTCIYADHPIVIGPSSIRVSASSIFSRLNILTRFRKEVLSWRRILAAE